MASVTFPVEFGGSGITITDDADPQTGLDGTGYITRFVPALQQGLAMTGHAVQKASEADQAATTATTAAQQASDDRDSINLDLQTLNGLVSEADASADAAAGSATTASNMADAAAEATATYSSVSAGLADTVDTDYFRVIEAPEAERISVYRNDAGAATLITTYYTKTGVDAKQAAAVRLNRSLQRLGDNGQTLHSDFNLDAYGLGSQLVGGVQDAMEAEELWDVERLSGTYALQHTDDGSLKYVEVPANTFAREWNPETGKYQAQISGSVTNEILNNKYANATSSVAPDNWVYQFQGGDRVVAASSYLTDVNAISHTGTNTRDTLQAFYTLATDTAFTASVHFEDATNADGVVFFIFSPDGAIVQDAALLYSEVIEQGRYELAFRTSSTPGTTVIRVGLGCTGNATGTVVHSLPQLVEGNVPGPVIVTEDTPVTRATDNPTRTLGAEFNQNEGSVFLSVFIENVAGAERFLYQTIADTTSNRVDLFISNNGDITFRTVIEGASSATITRAGLVEGGNIIAASFKNGEFSLSVNGQVSSSLSGVLPGNQEALNIGSYNNSSSFLNSPLSYFKYIPRALTATQLQELTSL